MAPPTAGPAGGHRLGRAAALDQPEAPGHSRPQRHELDEGGGHRPAHQAGRRADGLADRLRAPDHALDPLDLQARFVNGGAELVQQLARLPAQFVRLVAQVTHGAQQRGDGSQQGHHDQGGDHGHAHGYGVGGRQQGQVHRRLSLLTAAAGPTGAGGEGGAGN